MRTSTVLRTLWWLAGLALLLGLGRDAILSLTPPPRELPRFDGAIARPWVTGGFDLGGREPEPGSHRLPPRVETATSWVGTDAWRGRSESAWFKANRWLIQVGVKGYPQNPGCHLWAEFQLEDGRVTRVDCPLNNPREEWDVWEIRRPFGAVAVRIIGEDNSSAYAGWLAFSHQFRGWPASLVDAYQGLQILTTTALVLTLVWGPGLLWAPRRRPAAVEAAYLLGSGPLLLALLGIIIWAGSAAVRPQWAGLTLVAMLWAALGLTARRRAFRLEVHAGLRRTLVLSALLVGVVVARSAHSVGPSGELFRGTVSRNFELSDRIDSRFSFYTVQAAAHHWAPGSPRTERFFSPWTFFSRGPLAGLSAIPVVMATQGQPPTTLPENRWTPYDGTGFAAYRITLIVLASTVIVAVYLLLVPLTGAGWAALGAALLGLCPFGVHEIMFTWPKWAATAWVAVSFGLTHARRPLGAGLALGLGFLFHPLALLWAPWISLWGAGRELGSSLRPPLLALLRYGAGVASLALPWMALGALMPVHHPETVLAGQGGFLRYWTLADWHHATWRTWWHTRWLNFANTFLPLHGFFSEVSYRHPKLGSAYEESGPLLKFAELWWNSLPFAAGLGLWVASGFGVVRALRGLAAAALLFVLLPSVFIVAYWGMDPLGLMRECGHPLLVGLVCLTCVVASRRGGRLEAALRHPVTPWLQLPETWLMLWLTTLLNPAPWPAHFNRLDPVYLVLSTVLLLLAAFWAARTRVALAPRAAPRHAPPPTAFWDTWRRPHWLGPRALMAAVALALALWGSVLLARSGRHAPAVPGLASALSGSFQRDGHFPGEPWIQGEAIRTWGSWSGDDQHVGRIALGPFPCPPRLRLAVGGYPGRPGNSLYLEHPATAARLPVPVPADIGERWRPAELTPPADWIGQPVRLVADDQARQLGGWLAVSEPFLTAEEQGSRRYWPALGALALAAVIAFAATRLRR